MTREEAKLQAGMRILDKVIIDKIYDDFEKELKEAQDRVDSFCNLNNAVNEAFKELQSRTCENCKHSSVAEDTYSGTIVSMFCAEGVGEFEVCDVMQNTPDFGCNKWEGRDDI